MRRVKFRRRRVEKTDYKARLALLKSGLPRLAVRKTNRYVIAQIVKSKEAQDAVVCCANSKELLNYGWSFSLKSIPAAYLTGFLLGTRAKKNKIKDVILDIGLQRSTKGSRIYAVLKGVIDAGLLAKYSEDVMPSKERLSGKHLKNAERIEEEKNKVKEKMIK